MFLEKFSEFLGVTSCNLGVELIQDLVETLEHLDGFQLTRRSRQAKELFSGKSWVVEGFICCHIHLDSQFSSSRAKELYIHVYGGRPPLLKGKPNCSVQFLPIWSNEKHSGRQSSTEGFVHHSLKEYLNGLSRLRLSFCHFLDADEAF